MKTFTKSLFAGALMLTAGSATAANISIGMSGSATAESDFKDLLKPGYVSENFDSLGNNPVSYTGGSNAQNQQLSWMDSSPTFSTNVGTFTLTESGQTFTNDKLAADDGDNLKIESAGTGEFGREVLSSYEGDFWLDSNDAKKVEWNFNSGGVAGRYLNAFGFYIADPADIRAQLTLIFENGGFSDSFTIPNGQTNGNKGFVTVKSDMNVVGGILTFDNSKKNDGWGIDDVTVGRLPEPGTLLLMGLGLLGLGAARRRAAK